MRMGAAGSFGGERSGTTQAPPCPQTAALEVSVSQGPVAEQDTDNCRSPGCVHTRQIESVVLLPAQQCRLGRLVPSRSQRHAIKGGSVAARVYAHARGWKVPRSRGNSGSHDGLCAAGSQCCLITPMHPFEPEIRAHASLARLPRAWAGCAPDHAMGVGPTSAVSS